MCDKNVLANKNCPDLSHKESWYVLLQLANAEFFQCEWYKPEWNLVL